MKAVVIGGSVGGLFAGNMLRARGWDVHVYDQVATTLASRGAGIAGHVELGALLRKAGVKAPARGIEVDGRVAYDRAGAVLARYAHNQYLTSWSFVYRHLVDAFPADCYHLGKALVDLDLSGSRPVAVFADGERVDGDIVIGADGFRSRVRELVAPGITPQYAGYVAYRGVMDESSLSEDFRAETVGLWAFVFPGDGQLIGYPLLGTDDSADPGKRRYSYLWYRHTTASELDDLLTDASGVLHSHSIPPPLIRPEHIERLKRHAASTLPAAFAEIVLNAQQHLFQPIYDVCSEQIAFGPVALLGDAAFVARPHVGIGVLKAAQDADALVDCLAACSQGTAPADALAQYDALRVPAGRCAVRFGQHLGWFIEHGHESPWSVGSLGQSPEYLIRVSARPMEHIRQDLERIAIL